MNSNDEILNKRLNNLKSLYKSYPILNKINVKNNEIISKQAIFKTLYADEYIKAENGSCGGILFVIKGKIKIQKVNEEGEETNLYNIGQGEFCHEALSCLSNFDSLKTCIILVYFGNSSGALKSTWGPTPIPCCDNATC